MGDQRRVCGAAGLRLLAFAVCAVFAAVKGGSILHPRSWTLLPADWGQEREVVFAIDGFAKAYEAAYAALSDFCAAEGLGRKTSDLAAHASEELALLIVEHRRAERSELGRLQRVGKTVTGAGAEQKTAVEYRLVVIGDELSLRLRFAGLPYNPLAAERVPGPMSCSSLTCPRPRRITATRWGSTT